MSIVARFEVSGMDTTKYDQILHRLADAGLGAPDGRAYHIAYGDVRSLQVIDVFESQAKLEAFGAKLMPILQEFGVEAKPEVAEIHNIIKA